MNEELQGVLDLLENEAGKSPHLKSTQFATGVVSLEALSSDIHDIVSQDISDTDDRLQMLIGEAVPAMESAQFEAGLIAYGRAMDPSVSLVKQRATPETKANTSIINTVGIHDTLTDVEASMESYDGKSPSKTVAFSTAYNMFGIKQDEFSELFFPTYVMSPGQSSFSISIAVESVMTEILRNDGKPDKNKFNKIALIRAYATGEGLEVDKNTVIPVSNAKSASLLATTHNKTIVHPDTKESIVTAPYLFSKDIPVLNISQSPAQLAKGIMDGTDTLDPSVTLKNVTATLDSGAEVFEFDFTGFAGTGFTATFEGESKDIGLNFKTEMFAINVSAVKTTSGVVSPSLSALGEDATAYFKVVIKGDGNMAEGDISVYLNAFELIDVKDASGTSIPLDAGVGLTVANALADLTVVGYGLEAYTTNSNQRKVGQISTVDVYTNVYTVPFRSPVSALSPINDGGHKENDGNLLGALINNAGLRTSQSAMDTLNLYVARMTAHVNNGLNIVDLPISGIARHVVDPFFEVVDVNVSNKVDSQNSTERRNDIQSVISNHIIDVVTRMASDTGYKTAHAFNKNRMNANIGVAIGVGENLRSYIDPKLEIGDGYDVKIAFTSKHAMRDKIYVTFTDLSPNRTKAPDPLSFGSFAWSPEIVTDATRTLNGAVSRQLINTPAFRHFVNLPLFAALNVTGIQNALGQVVAQRHNV